MPDDDFLEESTLLESPEPPTPPRPLMPSRKELKSLRSRAGNKLPPLSRERDFLDLENDRDAIFWPDPD